MTTNLHPLRRESKPSVSVLTPSIVATLCFIAHRVRLIHATCPREVYNRSVVFINHLCCTNMLQRGVIFTVFASCDLCVRFGPHQFSDQDSHS